MPPDQKTRQFEQLFLPYLNSAYNLARWLTASDADARDVVQEAYLRAFRFFDSFRGGNPRAWLYTIVRNTSRSLHAGNRAAGPDEEFDEEQHPEGLTDPQAGDPAVLAEQALTLARVERALQQLPREYQEVLVLRELEEFSYQEIADMIDVPIGTVMSRLARARRQLRTALGAAPSGDEDP